jgi:hypothetical protein
MSLVWGRFNYSVTSKDQFGEFMAEYWERLERNRKALLREGDIVLVRTKELDSFDFPSDPYRVIDKKNPAPLLGSI